MLRALQRPSPRKSERRAWRWRQCRAHFGTACGGTRCARRPFQRGVERCHVDDEMAAEMFTCVGIRVVLNLAPTLADAYRGRGVRQLQASN